MSDHPLPRDQLEALYKRARSRVELLEKALAEALIDGDRLAVRVELLESVIDRAGATLRSAGDNGA